MNILIVGEFSGFAKHLKNGFIKLGHQVTIVHSRDGFKDFKAEDGDIFYSNPQNLTLGFCSIPYSNVLLRNKINKNLKRDLDNRGLFDVIIIICDVFVSSKFSELGIPLSYLRNQVKNGAKIIFTSCGGDAAYLKYLKEQKFYKIAFPNGIKSSRINTKRLKKILDITYAIVPTAYDYYHTMTRFLEKDYHKSVSIKFIPLPITIGPVNITSCIGRKIVIFHGIIRPIRKGTPFFEEALRRIAEDLPDKVEIIIDGKMPYDKYIRVFERMDILLDQTNGYGMGINANLGLMNGKVVFSGNEPEEEAYRGYESPVINATPDSIDIYEKLKYLILHPEEIDRIKKESRVYAEKYLDSSIVAASYLDML